jgi:hypothetical protein
MYQPPGPPFLGEGEEKLGDTPRSPGRMHPAPLIHSASDSQHSPLRRTGGLAMSTITCKLCTTRAIYRGVQRGFATLRFYVSPKNRGLGGWNRDLSWIPHSACRELREAEGSGGWDLVLRQHPLGGSHHSVGYEEYGKVVGNHDQVLGCPERIAELRYGQHGIRGDEEESAADH